MFLHGGDKVLCSVLDSVGSSLEDLEFRVKGSATLLSMESHAKTPSSDPWYNRKWCLVRIFIGKYCM